MPDRKLVLWIGVPLLLAAIVSAVLIWPLNLEDLLTNLIVEIVGILLTVGFVDWLLKAREKEKWRLVDAVIRADFSAFALRVIAEITLFLSEAGYAIMGSTRPQPWRLTKAVPSTTSAEPATRTGAEMATRMCIEAAVEWVRVSRVRSGGSARGR